MKQNILLMIFYLMTMGTSTQATEDFSIGTSVALTGKYSHMGREQLNGYQMWVNEVNSLGGLQGRPVHLVYYDDESNPEKATQLYEKLITVDQVDLLWGPYTSKITMAASTVAEKYHFPMISTGASAPEIWERGYKNVFGLYTPATHYLGQILEVAQAQGLKKVALVYENTPDSQSFAEKIKTQLKQLNLDLIFEEEYRLGTTDFTPLMTKIKSHVPEIFIGGSYVSEPTSLLHQTKKFPLETKIFVFAVSPEFSNFPKDSKSIISYTQWESILNIPGAKEFSIRYQKLYGHRPEYPAAGGYGAGQVLAAALRESRSLEHHQLRQTLLHLKALTIFGPYQVDSTGKQIGKPSYAIQWMKEEQQVLLPTKIITPNPFYIFSID